MARALACLLLAVIAADVAADATCDELTLGPVPTALVREAGPDGQGEACRDLCVPDCFCCSRSLAAGPAVLPPEPQPLASLAAVAALRRPAGVRPVLDPPPLIQA